MRLPNPPRVMIFELPEDQQRKVIKLALLVVAALASGREWDALAEIEHTQMDNEEKLAFGSLLDSQQAATIVGLRNIS